jgi:hypothetical protein
MDPEVLGRRVSFLGFFHKFTATHKERKKKQKRKKATATPKYSDRSYRCSEYL